MSKILFTFIIGLSFLSSAIAQETIEEKLLDKSKLSPLINKRAAFDFKRNCNLSILSPKVENEGENKETESTISVQMICQGLPGKAFTYSFYSVDEENLFEKRHMLASRITADLKSVSSIKRSTTLGMHKGGTAFTIGTFQDFASEVWAEISPSMARDIYRKFKHQAPKERKGHLWLKTSLMWRFSQINPLNSALYIQSSIYHQEKQVFLNGRPLILSQSMSLGKVNVAFEAIDGSNILIELIDYKGRPFILSHNKWMGYLDYSLSLGVEAMRLSATHLDAMVALGLGAGINYNQVINVSLDAKAYASLRKTRDFEVSLKISTSPSNWFATPHQYLKPFSLFLSGHYHYLDSDVAPEDRESFTHSATPYGLSTRIGVEARY